MRLIDADEIVYESITSSDTERYDRLYCDEGILAVRKEDIDIMTTIQPKMGKWIYQLRDSENEEYRCDQCNEPVGRKTKFCPNCGARMVTE